MHFRFTWDERKEQDNIKKHGIAFDEAASIFQSFPLRVFYDPDHSEAEDRFIAIGISYRRRLLLVIHMENETGTVIRIISARRATKRESLKTFGGGIK